MFGRDVRSIPIIPWLKANGYEDIAQTIETLILSWRLKGKKTRRNWWEILAGDQNGNPRTVDGIIFPVLEAAQVRQGIPISKNAISRGEDYKMLAKWQMGRWPNKNGNVYSTSFKDVLIHRLPTFAEYLATGHLGILSPTLTLEQTIREWGPPHATNSYDDMPSPFTNELIRQDNLYYGDLFLAFFGQRFYQYNLEVRYQTQEGLPASLNAFWYNRVSQWQPKQFQWFLKRICLTSRCYRLVDQYDPDDEELVIVIASSKLYWFFDNGQLYKVSWKRLDDDEEHFFSSLGATLIWQT